MRPSHRHGLRSSRGHCLLRETSSFFWLEKRDQLRGRDNAAYPGLYAFFGSDNRDVRVEQVNTAFKYNRGRIDPSPVNIDEVDIADTQQRD
jgi:hypothetical protein